MSQLVRLTLQTLTCLRETASPSSPYLWTAFVWIDTNTASVKILTPVDSEDRMVLSSNLQPGDSAAIPELVGALGQFFDDLSTIIIIAVTALWQKKDSPANTVDAGFEAFGTSIPAAITANLELLADTSTQQQGENNVKMQVQGAITNAISNSLSDSQKLQIWLGVLSLDAFIDSSSVAFRPVMPQSVEITLGDQTGPHFYRIDGNLQVTSDPCQSQVDAVNKATNTVNSINSQIQTLEKQFANASTSQKQVIKEEIALAKKQLSDAQTALENAKQALATCRAKPR